MTPENFVYWLQGLFEVADPATLDARQTRIIKDHLALVLQKTTPDRNAVPALPDPLRKFCSGPPLTLEGLRGTVVNLGDVENALRATRVC